MTDHILHYEIKLFQIIHFWQSLRTDQWFVYFAKPYDVEREIEFYVGLKSKFQWTVIELKKIYFKRVPILNVFWAAL